MTYEAFKNKYNIQLNQNQEQAVRAVDGAYLLLAVPGSGKTTVLVTRLGYMIYALGINPQSILTMTYTVAATRDMRERFMQIFSTEEIPPMNFRTINGVSAFIIRYYERSLGHTAFSLIEEADHTKLISEIYRAKYNNFAQESEIKSIKSLITYTKNMMLNSDEIDQLKGDGFNFSEIYTEYCRIMREKHLMDYDDQMVYAYNILRKYPHILEHFRNTYRYICVDEAQDTSKIQHKIIHLLVGNKSNIFMVGDEDQSIYGFRAAYPEALIDFEKFYPHSKILLMEQNYRSTKRIVNAADRFINQNKARHPKHMHTQNELGKEIKAITVADRQSQYKLLTDIALKCTSQTAVLYRDNDSAIPLIDFLSRNGIPYTCRRIETAFFTHYIIRDIKDIFYFANNPYDPECFMRVYYKLGAGISKVEATGAVKLSQESGKPLLEIILMDDSISKWKQNKISTLIELLKKITYENASLALHHIIRTIGYGEFLSDRGSDTGKVDILFALAEESKNLQQLFCRLDELENIILNSPNTESDFILSTIHSSKGLEYDNVILIDVADGIFPKSDPHPVAPEDIKALEEERRLFYVGITRAKKELSIIKYTSPDLSSTFSNFIFLKKTQTNNKAIQKKFNKNTVSPDNLNVGTEFEHKIFGKVCITTINDGIATIKLKNHTVKSIDLSFALSNGIIIHIY